MYALFISHRGGSSDRNRAAAQCSAHTHQLNASSRLSMWPVVLLIHMIR
jgi:hypothetical protein